MCSFAVIYLLRTLFVTLYLLAKNVLGASASKVSCVYRDLWTGPANVTAH